MAEFIEVLSPKALADLDKLNSMLVETVLSVDKVSQKFKNITTPSGVDSGLKGLTAEYAKQEKLIADLQIKLQRLAQAQQQTITATNRAEASTMRLNKQKEAQVKALEREQAKLEASANLYNKVQAKMNALSNEYKALATRKELFNNLTAKEEQRYTSLQNRIQKYDQTLKAVDASMGKYQRNVGNYASAFNPLGNSINQLTREMPAFANSVQTGFMAISNNLPIFFDSIQEVIRQNKELQAQGQPTKSVLSQLAGSFFSLGTALSVGVTLLTIYGKDIVEFASKAFSASKGIDAIKESQKQLNDINVQGRKDAVEEQLRLKTLLEVAKDTTLSYKERMIAVKELQETYPAYFGNLKEEKILAGQTAEAEKSLTEAILDRAKANAAVAKITENQSKIIDLEVRKLELIRKQQKLQLEVDRQRKVQASTVGGGTVAGTYDLETTAITRLASVTSELNEVNTEKASLEKINNTLTSFAIERQKESINLDYKETKAKKEKKKAQEEYIDPSSLQAMENMISALEKELQVTDLTSERYNFLSGVLSAVKQSYEALQEAMKDKEPLEIQSNGIAQVIDAGDLLHKSAQANIQDLIKQTEQTEKQKKALKELEKIMQDYVASFSADFFNRSGFPTLFKALNGEILGFGENWKVTFQAIGEIAQETFNFATQMSRNSFQEAFANLQREKEIAIAFAGDSATAREEIERQYQERQRELKRQQAKQERDMAIFNIIIDTAQGVVSALASTPPNVPLSIAIGAIGAAQLAMVAAQQIPEFYKGTDNAPEGWAWTQERGREIITDKHGRVKSTGSDGGAKLTYLNKGDKVFDATKSALMFDNALNSLLMDRGISMPKVEVNNGLNEAHVNRIVKAVQSIDPVSLNIDKGGLNAYVGNGHSRKELANMRVRGRGRSV
jgi:hypothetical protein